MKKKSFIVGGIVAVVIILIAVLCFIVFRNNNKYCSVIPQDACVVLRVDAKSFIEKHDIDTKYLESILKLANVSSLYDAGINFDEPAYAFAQPNGVIGVVVPVNDGEKLENLLNYTSTFVGSKVKSHQGYRWLETSDIVIAFDDTRLLALSGAGMNSRGKILELMEQDADESVLSTKLFSDLSSLDKPLAMVTSTSMLPESLTKMMPVLNGSDLKNLDLNALVSLDIVKDKALLEVEVKANNDESQALLDKNAAMCHKINGAFLSSGLNDALVWASFNIDGSQLTSVLPSDISKDINLSSINGDVTVMYKDKGNEFVLLAQVADKSILNIVQTLTDVSGGQLQAMKLNDSKYVFNIASNAYFAGVNGKTFYLTNSSELSNNIDRDVVTGVEFLKDEITDSYAFATLNVSPLVTSQLSGQYALMFGTYATKLLSLDRFTLVAKSPYRYQMTLSVKDGQDFVETMLQ